MALQLNLLHEEFQEQRQRQRDPLKIGMMVLGTLGALMFLYYMWNAYQTLGIRNRLNAVRLDWSKVEPKVTSAQKRSAELTGIIGTTKVLDTMIDSRFFWAPFLEILSHCVALNAQITSVDGTVLDDNKGVNVMIEGLAAGREPRAAAEELRQLLLEQLGQRYNPPYPVVNPAYDAGFKAGHDSAFVLGERERAEVHQRCDTEIATNHYAKKSFDEGFAAGTSAAEKKDKDVKVEFKTLEDLDTLVKIGGTNMAMARFGLSVSFNPSATAKAAPPPVKTPRK
jgi:hypothetical protein